MKINDILNIVMPKTVGKYKIELYDFTIISLDITKMISAIDYNMVVTRKATMRHNIMVGAETMWSQEYAKQIYLTAHCAAMQLLLWKLGVTSDEEDCYHRV
jgi:hypothetical protein